MKLFLIAGLLINSCMSEKIARRAEKDIEEYKLRMSDQDTVSGMEKSLNTIPQILTHTPINHDYAYRRKLAV